MEDKIYNELGNLGTVVRNPRYLVKLKGTDETYGMLSVHGYGVQEVAEWIVMQLNYVGMSDARKFCQEHNPTLLLTIVETGETVERHYQA